MSTPAQSAPTPLDTPCTYKCEAWPECACAPAMPAGDVVLPPLPEPAGFIPWTGRLFTAEHMAEYARAAVLADRAALIAALKKANDQAEHFEREWYLRGDEIERLQASAPTQPTIDMVLHCPACGMQHVDEPETGPDGDSHHDIVTWTNPPHRSHLCHDCGHIWRPSDVPTNGVPAVKTKGKADSPVAAPTQQAEPPEGFRFVAVNEGFTGLMDALERAHRKGYMPDAITEDYEGFDWRDAAPTPTPKGST